jgi:hypothetical protein
MHGTAKSWPQGSHLYIRKVIELRKAAKFSQHKILLVRCDPEHGELRELTLPAAIFGCLRRALTTANTGHRAVIPREGLNQSKLAVFLFEIGLASSCFSRSSS